MAVPAVALTHRSAKVTKFGIEVPSGLTYQGWEPGGEYTKTLVLKNVQLKTKKIRFKLPGGKFFSAVYPQPVVLSAGTSYGLPITFRPTAESPHKEHIEIETSEGTIEVPIKALLPRPLLSLPDSLKFSMCAVQDSITVNFEISNIGSVPTDFSWKVPNGFLISPILGSLTPKQTCKLTATFQPQTAKVYSAVAVCSYGEKEHCSTKSMRLQGIGKYPHVTVKCSSGKAAVKKSQQERATVTHVLGDTGAKVNPADVGSGEDALCEVLVDFGAVAVGAVVEKWIEITNVSPVPATFSVTPLPSIHLPEPLFSCSKCEGMLQPHASNRVKVVYSPFLLTSHPSTGYFLVKAQGGLAATTVKCVGKPIGPRVSIEEPVVSFGDVECGKTSTGVMHIKNDSDIATVFQLQLDSSSVFCADVLCKWLPAHSSQTIIVHFNPHKPIPHCKRVTCLVHHQDPLFVYLIGTGFTETVKPVVLQLKHVSTFQSHACSGLSRMPPEQLQQYIKEGKLQPDSSGILQPSEGFEIPAPAPPSQDKSACAQYLHSEHEPSGVPHISVDADTLKFGYCSPNHTSGSKLVSITNHTLGTVCCVWMTGTCMEVESVVPSSPGEGKRLVPQYALPNAFHIVPEERDIPPGKTGAFTINFKPGKPSQFYGKQLECFAFYKALRDYQHADANTIHPPWCITVEASGHTFAPGVEPFLPKLTFDTENLVFPATVPGCPVYRTAVMKNTGDTPLLFDLSHDPTGTFVVKPSHGLLEHSYQLFMLQMLPREHKLYKHIVKCHLNSHEDTHQELLLSGSGEVPSITLTNEGRLFFKPTCVGTTSALSYDITNSSRLPVRFEWKLSDVEQEILKVQPASGIILPYETQSQKWQFSPRENKHYALKVVLQASLDSGIGEMKPTPKKTKILLSVFGKGVWGEIKCNPSSLDCGTVIIKTSQCHTHTLTLTNPTPSTLYYQLHVDEEAGEGERPLTASSQGILELSPCEGVLPACSRETIRVVVRPSVRAHHCCKVTYKLLPAPKAKQAVTLPLDTATPDPTLCTINVTGAYPLLSVADVQGEGVASTLSKAGLWSTLSIDQLNRHLSEEPSSSELRYAIATRHSMRRRVPVRTRAIVDFNFGAAPVHSGSSVVHLLLENAGDVPAEWAFQFPMDMHLEPEYWAETGKLDEVERHELDVVNNKLFTVHPKNGVLQPGGRTTIICSYEHSQIGTSKLPVLLKVNRGREILLNWTGVTVECGHPYVHFTSHQHNFAPVPIGGHAYPRQVYELHNAGDVPVEYKVDTKPLEALRDSNYLMSILECLQPNGEIPAGKTVLLQFVFSPLEAKKYTVDLPIHFSNGDMVIVTFTGEGYDMMTLVDGATPPNTQNTQEIPVHLAITIPGQLAHLSQERISFSHLPLFSTVRRLVFITNTSLHTLSFQWELSSERTNNVLSVQPASGYIQPQQSAACRVTFCSHSSPSYYNVDILCKVTDESELLSYQQQLQEWERLEEEKGHTFTITESTKKRPKTMPSKLKPVGAKSKVRPKSSDSELKGKYQTLPPIGSSEEMYEEWKKKDLSIKSKTRPRTKKQSNNKPPTPPQVLFLHLGVTARTYSIPDYALLYDDLDSFYIDQQGLLAGSPETMLEGGNALSQGLKVKSEERGMLLCILSQMIRELLEDSNFHSAVQRVVEEPIPYFTQFSCCPKPSGAIKQSAHQYLSTTRLEDISSEGQHPLPHLHTPPTSQSQTVLHSDEGVQSELDVEAQIGSVASIQEEVPTDTTDLDAMIKHLPEFNSLIEGIMENTVLNILMEANSGELNITAPIFTIAKCPPET